MEKNTLRIEKKIKERKEGRKLKNGNRVEDIENGEGRERKGKER